MAMHMSFDEYNTMNERLMWKEYPSVPQTYILEDVTDYNGFSKASVNRTYQMVIGATVSKLNLVRHPNDPEHMFYAILPIVTDRFGNPIGSDLKTSQLEHVEESPTKVKLMTKNSVFILKKV